MGHREKVGHQEQSWEEREAEISVGGRVGREVTIESLEDEMRKEEEGHHWDEVEEEEGHHWEEVVGRHCEEGQQKGLKGDQREHLAVGVGR